MNPDPGHGLLQILSFSTAFANGHYEYTSAVSSAFVGLATIWIGMWWSQKYSADDASITLFRRPKKRFGSLQIVRRWPPWIWRWWS